MPNRPNETISDSEYPSTTYSWYVVVVLTAAYVVSFLDRQILALLVTPIQADLGVSDTQMGLLMGPAFALFYTVLGLPIGRMADRYSRRGIIAGGITIWCFMTAACGLSKNFAQLFLARVGVGVGEATLNPSALSLISDYFPREKRSRPISFYNMGVSLGAGIAMILGGMIIATVTDAEPIQWPFIGEMQPWQTVFLLVGLPGLVIAALMATVREPARHDRIVMTNAAGEQTEEISIRETVRYLTNRWRTYGSHFLGMSIVTVIGYGYFFWIPTMFVRTWDWSIPKISFTYGVLNLICGPIGVLFGGWLAEKLVQRGTRDGPMRVCVWFAFIMVPGAVLVPLMPTAELAVAMLVPTSISAAAVTATGIAGLLMISPNQLRAQSTALYYFTISIIGLSIGSFVVGFITDSVFADPAALRYSLSLVSGVTGVVALVLLTIHLRYFRAAAAEAESWGR